jgi:hypothetical protein
LKKRSDARPAAPARHVDRRAGPTRRQTAVRIRLEANIELLEISST